MPTRHSTAGRLADEVFDLLEDSAAEAIKFGVEAATAHFERELRELLECLLVNALHRYVAAYVVDDLNQAFDGRQENRTVRQSLEGKPWIVDSTPHKAVKSWVALRDVKPLLGSPATRLSWQGRPRIAPSYIFLIPQIRHWSFLGRRMSSRSPLARKTCSALWKRLPNVAQKAVRWKDCRVWVYNETEGLAWGHEPAMQITRWYLFKRNESQIKRTLSTLAGEPCADNTFFLQAAAMSSSHRISTRNLKTPVVLLPRA
ncbi:hypothetical protein K470DRAFT_135667 [Piedraia hortae CBS 480.64]|uniref:Uncharacterized protein n=1 Tax=Piedraia hortae CBS 480.64 TaxID=1314780 RepID=A0A6A7BST6_9PEZI|nr:hypothetical protein K470DRAFT_135667 [Piedraia hortae CBS 480.64]